MLVDEEANGGAGGSTVVYGADSAAQASGSTGCWSVLSDSVRNGGGQLRFAMVCSLASYRAWQLSPLRRKSYEEKKLNQYKEEAARREETHQKRKRNTKEQKGQQGNSALNNIFRPAA